MLEASFPPVLQTIKALSIAILRSTIVGRCDANDVRTQESVSCRPIAFVSASFSASSMEQLPAADITAMMKNKRAMRVITGT